MLQFILLIIVGFFIGLSYPTGIEPLFFNPFISLAATLVSSALYIGLGFILVGYFFKKLRLDPDPNRLTYIKSYYRWLSFYRILILPAYAIQIFLLHWPLVITQWLGLNLIFITYLLILLPFLTTYILTWIPLYRMDRHIRGSTWSLTEYLSFQIRGYFLMIVIPLLVLMFYVDFIEHVPALFEMIYIYPFSGWIISLSIILLMCLTAPYALMILWGTKPLPQGELRQRLENLVREAGLKIKDILVWSLGRGRMANAMIIGLVPQVRYIIFTDTLLNNLNPDEIETVFGHEIGHAKHHHLRFYFFFALGYLFLALSIEEFSRDLSGLMILNLFALVVIYWGVIFSAISKQLEKQSDLFGASITNNFDGFISALQKIAWLNGQLPSARSLQHPSIEKRVGFLKVVQQLPELGLQFQHTLNKYLRLFMGLIILSLIVAGWSIYQQTQRIPVLKARFAIQTLAHQLAQQGCQHIEAKQYGPAIESLNQAIAFAPYQPLYHIWLGDAYTERDGQISAEAHQAYQNARKLKPIKLRQRMYLYDRIYKKPSD